ncbi:Nodulin-like / Major Facilitator Superfamily protein [Tripterygium wilfordii]|uniref:Nodulin-like / Major Facilitator Superfamily protein n=1 Tax=Tripterygium wilfordii TaxID=458696 RepID=A0A7J7CJB6_TRIWF|nr:protein NUCLEAR FUSION DEFECTIVE 4-like [Tripterygium wilfordii]KAF5734158.1 Nodulin-like / Major Facilitator Superfamily protein [Tripterygium wilfordii]
MERSPGLLFNKWITTIASIWIQCGGGSSYTFGIYSSVLKSTQGYDQSTLDVVSVFKDIGANVGVLSGVLYSNNRYGPWVVHLAGAIQCFAGYFLMWTSVVGLIKPPPLPLMCVFMLLAAHAQTFFNTANVVTGVRNFTDYGGTIVGIMKGFLGLSGAILIQVYATLCEGNPSTFILILAFLPTILSLSLMCLVRIHETNTVDDKKYLNGLSTFSLIIAGYLMIIIILDNVFTLPLLVRTVTFVLLLLLLSLPLVIAVKAQKDYAMRFQQEFSIETTPLLNKTGHPTATFGDERVPLNEDEMNLWQAVCTGNFWLLFVSMLCGMGSGLATINNMSQIGESLHYTTTEINSLISLWSIWNFLGRFGAGYVSDVFLHKKGCARPLFIAITLATMTVGHIVIASGFSKNLYIGSVVVGICYGSQWSLMPTITSEIFGVRNMGTIFNTIAIASPIGSYIFSVRVIGYIYDKVATGEHDSCFGTHCFMVSFLIMASVAFFGCLVALALFFRTRRFYERIVQRRLRRM